MAEARVIHTVAELRAALGATQPGLVPTMGALHEGHQALIRRSAAENEATVMTLFVNPTQFNDPSDFARYPRTLERDALLAGEAGADIVYAPDASRIYPEGFSTTVTVAGLTDRWEGAARPGHFAGVATVVAILHGSVRPARSYFGEKDYQQLQVIRRMHRDLLLPGEIVGCPTIRDPDGLAMSSRNARLSPRARARAAVIPRALAAMAALARDGEQSAAVLVEAGQAAMSAVREAAIDYLAIVDPATLEPVDAVGREARAIAAVVLDGVRLLDNAAIGPGIPPWDC
ncbi:MAG: pantoate--beta-alanine ligase [Chloroflexota bacterium]